MDKKKWSWLPEHMPAVAKLIQDRRKAYGAEHVNACWHHGVVKGEPGWFFAREGALMVGTPWDDEAITGTKWHFTQTEALLMMKKMEVQGGTN